ncbi:MAG TPA: PSP1 C-terminal domain-containing protein [Pirellulaceae bacterium]
MTDLMFRQHFVRIGVLGSVGRFAAAGAERLRRGSRVVCRTRRGLEVGDILSAAESDFADPIIESEGEILRRVTVEDDLLIARLEKNRMGAYEACCQRLAERGSSAILLDVEHLFDGRSLYFYFLGETTPELDALTAELADAYEAKAQLQKFAETLTAGCGPNCGTEEGAGCGSGGCSTCSVLSACGSKRVAAGE